MPLSLLFIKYYPNLGRSYDPWTGGQMFTGLTTDKNMLGVITFVLSLGALWRIVGLFRSEEVSWERRRHLVAQATLLVIGVWLLIQANSDTSIVGFALGAGLLLVTNLRYIRRHTAAVHILILSLILTGSLVKLLGGGASVAAALGRNPTLTGRTEIWAAIIPMSRNPLVGAGFESFWLNPDVAQRLAVVFPGLPLSEAHDGYIEVYLELGWAGVGLIGLVLIDGYRRSVKAFRRDPALGSLLIAYVVSAMVYSVTEAGFRMMDPIWIFFLLAVIESSSIAAGLSLGTSPRLETSPNRVSELPATNALAMTPTRRTMAGKSSNDERLNFNRGVRGW